MIWSNFATIIWEVLHKKTSFWALEKWKMVFSSNENENFLRQHCLPFQYAPFCTIWDHLNKLCHECGHKLIIWLESHESSRMTAHFSEHFFKIIVVLKVFLFFLPTWSHMMTQCEGFPIFWFFEFLMPVSKCGQNGGLDRS